MSDAVDIATETAEVNLAIILRNRPRLSSRPSATECEDCDSPIPTARQEAVPGIQKCVQCQQLADQHQGFNTGRYH